MTINLAIEHTTASIAPAVCESYLSPSGDYTWTESGIYADTLTNEAGCDSIITIDLVILEETTESIAITECFNYTSPSGLYLWTETGVYMDTIINEAGCDSIMTIDLTINTVNTGVSAADYELTALEEAASYQWLDCNNDWAVIDGATEQLFSPLENGSYAVIVTQDGCADTSDCYDITALTIGSFEKAGVRLYPNPTNGHFSIEFTELQTGIDIMIHNPAGQLVYLQNESNQKEVDIDLDVATGVYFITLNSDSGEELRKKIMIE